MRRAVHLKLEELEPRMVLSSVSLVQAPPLGPALLSGVNALTTWTGISTDKSQQLVLEYHTVLGRISGTATISNSSGAVLLQIKWTEVPKTGALTGSVTSSKFAGVSVGDRVTLTGPSATSSFTQVTIQIFKPRVTQPVYSQIFSKL